MNCKSVFFVLMLFLSFKNIKAQDLSFLNTIDCNIRLNEKYGDNSRNSFDIVLPKSKEPTALVIYIHGGGFVSGDKSAGFYRAKDVSFFLENNIAYATINYSYRKNNDKVGVKRCLKDIQRAIQYLRYHARDYNLNKQSFACYGNSAGAGASLYFAFHKDLAVENDSTLLGESTRLVCAGAIATQATYNLFKWKKIIPNFWFPLLLKKDFFYNNAANFYGYKTYDAFKPYKKEITASLDLLQLIDANDPPIYLMNLLKDTFPSNMNIIQHHKSHALYLAKELSKNNVKHKVYTYTNTINSEEDVDCKIREFLVSELR